MLLCFGDLGVAMLIASSVDFDSATPGIGIDAKGR
jgi:hypothetical protein